MRKSSSVIFLSYHLQCHKERVHIFTTVSHVTNSVEISAGYMRNDKTSFWMHPTERQVAFTGWTHISPSVRLKRNDFLEKYKFESIKLVNKMTQ